MIVRRPNRHNPWLPRAGGPLRAAYAEDDIVFMVEHIGEMSSGNDSGDWGNIVGIVHTPSAAFDLPNKAAHGGLL